MTTKHSPLRILKMQADQIAAMLKAAERGEKIDIRFAERITAARRSPSLKVGIAMDDRFISIEMPWATISGSTETSLAEFILKHMQEARESS